MRTATIKDFVAVLSDASQFHEGWGLFVNGAWNDTRSVKNNNPGNLKFIRQQGAVPGPDNFCIFQDFYAGKQAHIADIAAKVGAGDRTITDVFTIYLGTDANPTEIANYVNPVIAWFQSMGWVLDGHTPIAQIVAQNTKPVVLLDLNEIHEPGAWRLAILSIKGFAAAAHDFCVTTRYTNQRFQTFTALQYPTGLGIQGTYHSIAMSEIQAVLAPVNDGHEFNICLVNSAIYGPNASVGGEADEMHAVSFQEPNTVYAYAVLQTDATNSPVWADADSRVIFHEFIHELFGRVGDPDTLHAYLVANGGYGADLMADLAHVYGGEKTRYLLASKEESSLHKLVEYLTQLINLKKQNQ